MEFVHRSVLLDECIEALNIRPDGVYLDGTLGGAGHSLEIVRRLESGRLIGVDRDPKALEAAALRLAGFEDRVSFVHSNFSELKEILSGEGLSAVDGMLFDLGVSSPQLDEAERGFSYMADAPLDMRMDPGDELSADIIVNEWDESELKRIFYEYGEERYSGRIAAAVAKARRSSRIRSTFELVDVIKKALPAQALREKQHPAKRCFQALRIAVNGELAAVEKMLREAVPLLNPGGRLAVISFHSLEDRLVKSAMREAARGCICPADFPVCVCGRKPALRVITGKPVTAAARELEENPRARSAKLRVAEKL